VALHKDQAIILSSRVFGESDKILRFLTLRSGKLTGIAKGGKKSQKRFMNTLELFNHIDIEYFEKSEKGMVRIDNADLREANSGIESSFRRMCIASFFAEFVDRLTREKEPHADLFEVLKEALNKVKHVEFTYFDILYYQLGLLHRLGYMPNFTTCVQCGKDVSNDAPTSFSHERGGVVCGACASSVPHRRYPEGLLSRLADPAALKGAGTTAYGRHARELMEAFMHFHLNVEFKSYRLLKSAIG
jgi:DNA repair protein RecO (recombination protein O)